MYFPLDRVITYQTVEYRIVEVLNSETFLVVKEEDYKKGRFPLDTFVIPEED